MASCVPIGVRATLLGRLAVAGLCAVLAACAGVPMQQEPAPGGAPAAAPSRAVAGGRVIDRAHARWTTVAWSDLPGWGGDRLTELWPALLRGCDRPAAGWAGVCAAARLEPPPLADDDAVRIWFEQRLQPYRVDSPGGGNGADGLATGYFEPLVEASRTPRGAFRVPLHGPPTDLATKRPYWTRQQLDTSPLAQQSLRGRELAYVADRLDLLVLQVQGSGRLLLTEPDGSRKLVRVAFAGHNDQPYRSVGRWLIDQGELKPAAASWPTIKAWAQLHPDRVDELLWSNPRVVFFREEPLPDATLGPRGAQGVALTPGRSVAVDPQSVPYGTPVWLDTTEPLTATPLRRLAMAQDTGSAITGAVRVDYFWGWGDAAEQQAGRMKQPLRLWALWPK